MVVGNSKSTATKNAGKLMAILIAMEMQRYECGVHGPIEHIQGFTRSHWMPPLVNCLHSIALTVAVVDEFKRNTQTLPTTKTQLLASN